MSSPLRSEAAVTIGLVGAAATASAAAILGVSDAATAEQAWTLAGSALVPLVAGLITRGTVWSRKRAEELEARATAADSILGAGNTARLLDLARDRGVEVAEAVISGAIDRAERALDVPKL